MNSRFARFSMNRRHDACLAPAHGRCLRLLWVFAAASTTLGVGGCAVVGAKPWEHDLLAEHAMQVDPYPTQSAMDDHIYFSKEASSGGRGFAGGGCGCN